MLAVSGSIVLHPSLGSLSKLETTSVGISELEVKPLFLPDTHKYVEPIIAIAVARLVIE